MKNVTIYTDGACSGNPGPGGWAAILIWNGREKELSGGEAETTNNRMELLAAISGLEALKEPCRVTLYSDSKYLVDAVTLGWVYKWRDNGWMRTKREEAKNPELWQRLLSAMEKHEVEFSWVKGHEENEFNVKCDKIAVMESKKLIKNVKNKDLK
ncbi:MAG: ribonuclease HI [Oscillospiraceae bacterium]|nr:ribonuclease HI [Oscillospiraceae bacterium]